MSFSCKIVLSEHKKADGKHRLYLQAIIDRKRALVPFEFYIEEKHFDARGQRIRSSHRNAPAFNKEILKAITEANNIGSRFRLEDKKLTPRMFIEEFKHPSSEMDLIKFIKKELELKRPTIAHNTWKQHNTVVNKLTAFRKFIRFGDVNIEMVQQFKNHLIKTDGNSLPTVNKLLKILKQYIDDARDKGIKVDDPFKVVKIKAFRSNRLGLSQKEVDIMEEYFDDPGCPASHKKLLRYFLFSCHTGVRISDIGLITWNQIHDDVLMFVPEKTRNDGRMVVVPLLEKDKKFLPEYNPVHRTIFDTFSHPVSNRYLKQVADHLGIKKRITYHTSRHTFASLFAEGGDIQALQRMMGHGSIQTTMEYAKLSTKALVDAKRKRWEISPNPVQDSEPQ